MKRLLFVDDEQRVLQGIQRRFRGMRKEWEIDFAENGPKAIEMLKSKPVDVVVSDMMMPGMDGAQFLTEVISLSPKTVRFVLSGHSEREAVFRLIGPAHQYISKPCEGDELFAAISRAFSLRDLLSNQKLKQLVTQIRALPTLPSIHARLMEAFREKQPSAGLVGELISQDMGMTAKILQLVNSAFFGLGRPITRPVEAVNLLGMATVQSLFFSLEIFSQFDRRIMSDFSIAEMERHGCLTARFACNIARSENCDEACHDECFLAGLLHDVGRLILAAGMPDEYAGVIKKARDAGLPEWQVEREELGATHAEVGAYLLGLWGLPDAVVEAVALHHNPGGFAAKGFSTVLAVHAADLIAESRARASKGEADAPANLFHPDASGLDGRLGEWEKYCAEEEEREN